MSYKKKYMFIIGLLLLSILTPPLQGVKGDNENSSLNADIYYQNVGSDEGTFIFNANKSSPSSKIVGYVWEVGNHTPIYRKRIVKHNFKRPGKHKVLLTVYGNEGKYDMDSVSLHVSDDAPPKINVKKNSSGTKVSFSVDNTIDHGSSQLKYRWDWTNDGIVENLGRKISHNYINRDNYTANLTVVDDKGNEASKLLDVDLRVHDKWDPNVTITSPSMNEYLDEPNVKLKWDGEDDGSIDHYTVRRDGNSWINVKKNTSYNFIGLSDGDHTLQVKAYDTADNTTKRGVDITVDTTKPNADAGGPYSCDEESYVTFHGGGSSDNVGIESYEWEVDGRTGNGKDWSCYMYNHGTYTVTLTVTDKVGHQDQDQATVDVRNIDNSPPILDIVTPPQGLVTGKSYITAHWSGHDDHSDIATGMDHYGVRTESSGWENIGLQNEYKFGPFDTGVHYLWVLAEDNNNNIETERVRIKVDKAPPTADAGGPYVCDEDVPFTFNGSGSYDNQTSLSSYIWYYGDGYTGSGDGACPTHKYKDPGTYTVRLVVEDEAGNTDSDTTKIKVNDTTAPKVNILKPNPGEYINSSKVVLRWGATDNDEVKHCTVWKNDDVKHAVWDTRSYVFTGLDTDRKYTFTVRAFDYAGNYRTENVTFHVDYVAPVVNIDAPGEIDEDVKINFTGKNSYDSYCDELKYYWDLIGNSDIEKRGMNVSRVYPDPGNYTINLTVQDKAGNNNTKQFKLHVRDLNEVKLTGYSFDYGNTTTLDRNLRFNITVYNGSDGGKIRWCIVNDTWENYSETNYSDEDRQPKAGWRTINIDLDTNENTSYIRRFITEYKNSTVLFFRFILKDHANHTQAYKTRRIYLGAFDIDYSTSFPLDGSCISQKEKVIYRGQKQDIKNGLSKYWKYTDPTNYQKERYVYDPSGDSYLPIWITKHAIKYIRITKDDGSIDKRVKFLDESNYSYLWRVPEGNVPSSFFRIKPVKVDIKEAKFKVWVHKYLNPLDRWYKENLKENGYRTSYFSSDSFAFQGDSKNSTQSVYFNYDLDTFLVPAGERLLNPQLSDYLGSMSRKPSRFHKYLKNYKEWNKEEKFFSPIKPNPDGPFENYQQYSWYEEACFNGTIEFSDNKIGQLDENFWFRIVPNPSIAGVEHLYTPDRSSKTELSIIGSAEGYTKSYLKNVTVQLWFLDDAADSLIEPGVNRFREMYTTDMWSVMSNEATDIGPYYDHKSIIDLGDSNQFVVYAFHDDDNDNMSGPHEKEFATYFQEITFYSSHRNIDVMNLSSESFSRLLINADKARMNDLKDPGFKVASRWAEYQREFLTFDPSNPPAGIKRVEGKKDSLISTVLPQVRERNSVKKQEYPPMVGMFINGDAEIYSAFDFYPCNLLRPYNIYSYALVRKMPHMGEVHSERPWGANISRTRNDNIRMDFQHSLPSRPEILDLWGHSIDFHKRDLGRQHYKIEEIWEMGDNRTRNNHLYCNMYNKGLYDIEVKIMSNKIFADKGQKIKLKVTGKNRTWNYHGDIKLYIDGKPAGTFTLGNDGEKIIEYTIHEKTRFTVKPTGNEKLFLVPGKREDSVIVIAKGYKYHQYLRAGGIIIIFLCIIIFLQQISKVASREGWELKDMLGGKK